MGIYNKKFTVSIIDNRKKKTTGSRDLAVDSLEDLKIQLHNMGVRIAVISSLSITGGVNWADFSLTEPVNIIGLSENDFNRLTDKGLNRTMVDSSLVIIE